MLFHILCMVIVWHTMVMVYLFKKTWYFTVSKHHDIPCFPWYIMVFYHVLPVSKHHGILPRNRMVYFCKGTVLMWRGCLSAVLCVYATLTLEMIRIDDKIDCTVVSDMDRLKCSE